jgi:transposase-like protein
MLDDQDSDVASDADIRRYARSSPRVKRKPQGKRFSAAAKVKAVLDVHDGQRKSIVAKRMGVTLVSLNQWLKDARYQPTSKPLLSQPNKTEWEVFEVDSGTEVKLREEIARLRRHIATLEQERASIRAIIA